ncbi:MAG: hypothetical protein K9M44_05015 [Candidatus Pacebacteria bacterium]|nr:hypothetical protein [Candidatus Paceibacterota bacterium]
MFNKIAGFTLNSTEKNNSFTETYISQPDSAKERLAGKLFVLTDITGPLADCKSFSSFIIETLNSLYYNDEKILMREKLDNVRVENIFESILSKANEKIYQFLEEQKLLEKLEDINLLAGIAHDDEVHFSQAGSSKAFVLYKKEKQYEFMPVSTEDDDKKIRYNEIFSSLVSGSVPPGSFFIVSNEALAEYITTETLKEIITILPPISAIEQIKNRLKQINSRVSFAGIIIKNNFGQIDPESSQSSANVVNVQYAEEKTSSILSTAGVLSGKKVKKFFKLLSTKIKPKKKDPRIVSAPKKETETQEIKTSEPEKKSTKKIKLAPINLKDKIVFRKKPGIFSSLKKILPISYLKNRNNWRWHTPNFSKKNKAILIVVLALLLIFSINLMISKQKEKRLAQEEAYRQEIALIEQKQNQVDSYLLYKNEDSAKELLKESLTLINSLPKEEPVEQENYNKYLAKYEAQIDQIRHASSPQYTEVMTLPQDALLSAFGLTSDGLIYASDSQNKKIYLVTADTKNLQSLDVPSENVLSLNFGLSDRYNNLYFVNNSSFTQLLLEDKTLNSLTYQLPAEAGEITAGSSWFDNFYLFDNGKKQLYKYNKSNSDISFLNNWLKSSEGLEGLDIKDVAIDGNIYFLARSGEIKKFYTGEELEFSIDSTEPAIENAEKLIIQEDWLYIFEPTAKRLLKYKISGDSGEKAEFVEQFEIINLNELQDIAISSDNNSAYLLADNKIYLLNLNQNTEENTAD